MTARRVPEGWKIKPFGDLCSGRGEYGANVSKGPFDARLPRYVRITDIADNGLLRQTDPASISEEAACGYLLDPGDILLARSGATVGKSYVHEAHNGRCAYAGYLIKFRTRRDTLVPNYVKQVLRSESYWTWVRETQRAQAQPNINAAEYASLSILLPPLGEQRKIAAILSSVDDAIEATRAVIDQLQVVKKAMMAELLTRGLPGRHTRFKQTEIGEVPEDWEVLRFEDLLGDGDALSYGILQPGGDDPDGVPMLRTVDLNEQGGRSDTVVLKVSASIESAYVRTRLKGGEVLLSVMGTVGRTVVVPPEWRDWNVNRALAVIRVNHRITSGFLSLWVRSPSTQARFLIEQIGSAQKRINLGDLRQMLVPVPSSEEQRELLAALVSVEDRQRCEDSVCVSLQNAKSALMSVLLTGEVRVTPDEAVA